MPGPACKAQIGQRSCHLTTAMGAPWDAGGAGCGHGMGGHPSLPHLPTLGLKPIPAQVTNKGVAILETLAGPHGRRLALDAK
jgi:hypothetical protein